MSYCSAAVTVKLNVPKKHLLLMALVCNPEPPCGQKGVNAKCSSMCLCTTITPYMQSVVGTCGWMLLCK